MPNKAYVIFYDPDAQEFYFPIKRSGYCAGMPQFFGGTKNAGESDRDTLTREVLEESDEKLTLKSGGLHQIHHARINEYNYNFYVSTNFSGTHFLGAFKNTEMSSIVKYFVDVDSNVTDDIHDFMQRLKISITEEFAESETCEAFTRALAWAMED